MRVSWKEYTWYTSSTEFKEKAGAGELVGWIALSGDAVGIVKMRTKFTKVPMVFLEPEVDSPDYTSKPKS